MVQSNRNNENIFGNIEVSPAVIETIGQIAVDEIRGVQQASSTISAWISNSSQNKGVHLSNENGRLILDVYVDVYYGADVPKVARQIQENIKQQVYSMTEILLSEVNVHIVAIISSEDIGQSSGA